MHKRHRLHRPSVAWSDVLYVQTHNVNQVTLREKIDTTVRNEIDDQGT